MTKSHLWVKKASKDDARYEVNTRDPVYRMKNLNDIKIIENVTYYRGCQV